MHTRIRSLEHTLSMYSPHLLRIFYTRACIRTYVRASVACLHLHRLISIASLQAHAGQAQSLEAGCYGNDFADHLRLAIPQSLHRSHPVRTCVHLCQQTTVPKEMQGGQNPLHNSSASQSRHVAMPSWCS